MADPSYTAQVSVYGTDVQDLVRAARQHGTRLLGENKQKYTFAVQLGTITAPVTTDAGADSAAQRYAAVATITFTPPVTQP